MYHHDPISFSSLVVSAAIKMLKNIFTLIHFLVFKALSKDTSVNDTLHRQYVFSKDIRALQQLLVCI